MKTLMVLTLLLMLTVIGCSNSHRLTINRIEDHSYPDIFRMEFEDPERWQTEFIGQPFEIRWWTKSGKLTKPNSRREAVEDAEMYGTLYGIEKPSLGLMIQFERNFDSPDDCTSKDCPRGVKAYESSSVSCFYNDDHQEVVNDLKVTDHISVKGNLNRIERYKDEEFIGTWFIVTEWNKMFLTDCEVVPNAWYRWWYVN